ncbi:MAG: heavy-metal-associated domain-containing protein [Bacteroidota bacterium]
MKKTLTFSTNIKCGGCVEKIGPVLEQDERIIKWEIDLESPEKSLLIETEILSAKEIQAIGKTAGFTLKEKKAGFLRIFSGR